jgi:deoxyribonucleoside regulator
VAQASEDGGSGVWPEQLAVRIAWSYYMLGMTQQEIAEQIGVNRVRVNRILAEARRRGLVRITVNSKLVENIDLEHRLKERFGLRHAEVVLGSGKNETRLAEVLGAAACEPVAKHFQDGMTIGVGWGVTLKAFAEAMPELPLRNAAVVSMIGTLTRRSSIDAFEATTALSARLHAECFYLPGPIVCDSEASCRTLMRQPMLRDVLNRALAADLAVVSVGGLDSGTIRRMRFVEDDEFHHIERAGAIGNFLGYYIDEAAEIIDHPINRRVIGLRPEELARMPQRFMISGGPSKVRALSAILTRGLLTGLVTDANTARLLLGPR